MTMSDSGLEDEEEEVVVPPGELASAVGVEEGEEEEEEMEEGEASPELTPVGSSGPPPLGLRWLGAVITTCSMRPACMRPSLPPYSCMDEALPPSRLLHG